MVAQLFDPVLDGGLTILDTAAIQLTICGTEPTTFAQASTTYLLGFKNFGAGAVFGAPAAAGANGRKVTSAAVTDGTITTSGTANWWAAIDGSRLLAVGSLASAQVVTATNTFTLAAFDITIPAHA